MLPSLTVLFKVILIHFYHTRHTLKRVTIKRRPSPRGAILRPWGSPGAKGAITLTERLRPLRHCAGLSYHDITSSGCDVVMMKLATDLILNDAIYKGNLCMGVRGAYPPLFIRPSLRSFSHNRDLFKGGSTVYCPSLVGNMRHPGVEKDLRLQSCLRWIRSGCSPNDDSFSNRETANDFKSL